MQRAARETGKGIGLVRRGLVQLGLVRTFSAKKSLPGPHRKWLNIGKTMCCSTRRSHMLILAFSMGSTPHSFSPLP
jgi:hypothetical protein